MTGDEGLAEALADDYRKAEVPPAERALLDYAVKLTREPWAMTEDDVAALRAEGWSDTAVLDANLVTGYYAFANRLADGLGVELEDFWSEGGE
ncbi:MAG: peroxidase [bacterium]|nr:peroxidase [bacterium]